MGLLADLGQDSSVPYGDGYAAESGRGGQQEAGSPKAPRLRGDGGILYEHGTWCEIGKFSERHGRPKLYF
jgi:hypothetical protein